MDFEHKTIWDSTRSVLEKYSLLILIGVMGVILLIVMGIAEHKARKATMSADSALSDFKEKPKAQDNTVPDYKKKIAAKYAIVECNGRYKVAFLSADKVTWVNSVSEYSSLEEARKMRLGHIAYCIKKYEDEHSIWVRVE